MGNENTQDPGTVSSPSGNPRTHGHPAPPSPQDNNPNLPDQNNPNQPAQNPTERNKR